MKTKKNIIFFKVSSVMMTVFFLGVTALDILGIFSQKVSIIMQSSILIKIFLIMAPFVFCSWIYSMAKLPKDHKWYLWKPKTKSYI